MIARRIAVVVVALLLAAQVVRNAAVAALSPLHPNAAARLWLDHPFVEISLGLAEIGTAARMRKAIDARTFAMIDDAAAKAPLSADPYLVRGVQQQTAGDLEAARRAFLAAQWRDPRSMPAAYFLANYYLRAGRPLEGLEQTAILARLSPNGVSSAAPFVATYARNRSNWPQIRSLFRSQPGLEGGVLAALAQDPGNADAILALADQSHRKPDSDWLRVLLGALVANVDYGRAKGIWTSVGGGDSSGLVFDPTFSTPGPPPPFNWSFASSTVGLAERQSGNRLHLIFYGNEDGVLAGQLLLLTPGQYRLEMQLVGGSSRPELLQWSVRCDTSQDPFASIGVDEAARRGWSFSVPANCPAQRLELSGRSGDIAQQAEATITGFNLSRAGIDE